MPQWLAPHAWRALSMCLSMQAAPGPDSFWADMGYVDGAINALLGVYGQCMAAGLQANPAPLDIDKHGSACNTALCTMQCGT